ncbi:YtxH domain-containing protein [Thalassobacillus hwangdonensis]|uniref:YtxH domain-containing protein n=1 Tax=Thalassobacillus hwangdonensis TaxID=546108 RepID=A0ABW3L824_9BACI
MSEHKLWKSMLIGAAVGGVFALLDQGTRNHVVSGAKRAGGSARNFTQHPSEAVRAFRLQYEQFGSRLAEGAQDILEALEKLEDILEKVSEIDQVADDDYKSVQQDAS